MLENSASKRDISQFADFEEVVKSIPDLSIHVDIAHAYLHGGLAHIDQFLRGFRDRLAHVHVSDNHGKDDEHLPVGEGKINFERVVKTLKRIKYDGTITFEIFQRKKEGLPRSLVTFKRLWDRI
jgi:sugar phosphate isomerase/epimerase